MTIEVSQVTTVRGRNKNVMKRFNLTLTGTDPALAVTFKGCIAGRRVNTEDCFVFSPQTKGDDGGRFNVADFSPSLKTKILWELQRLGEGV